jgi:hypothetical protein
MAFDLFGGKHYLMRQPNNPYKNDPGAVPPAGGGHDHLIPTANRLLAMTAKGVWKGAKLLVRVALSLPRLFVRVNHKPTRPDHPDRERPS